MVAALVQDRGRDDAGGHGDEVKSRDEGHGEDAMQSAQQGTLTEYNLMMAGAVVSLVPALVLLIALRKNLLTTMGLEVN